TSARRSTLTSVGCPPDHSASVTIARSQWQSPERRVRRRNPVGIRNLEPRGTMIAAASLSFALGLASSGGVAPPPMLDTLRLEVGSPEVDGTPVPASSGPQPRLPG